MITQAKELFNTLYNIHENSDNVDMAFLINSFYFVLEPNQISIMGIKGLDLDEYPGDLAELEPDMDTYMTVILETGEIVVGNESLRAELATVATAGVLLSIKELNGSVDIEENLIFEEILNM